MARPLPSSPLCSITEFPQPQGRILPRAVPSRAGVALGHFTLPRETAFFF